MFSRSIHYRTFALKTSQTCYILRYIEFIISLIRTLMFNFDKGSLIGYVGWNAHGLRSNLEEAEW